MRVQNTSATATDNIFIDIFQFESYTRTLILNGLSDHDAQLVKISTDYSHTRIQEPKPSQKLNMYTISDFINKGIPSLTVMMSMLC